MKALTQREKLILAGLYLSKFDKRGLARLGFGSFTEAFNAIGLSLKGRPASLKNYRDEFDPLFPNPRQGWHKRPLRKYCEEVFTEFGQLGLDAFADLLQSLVMGAPVVEGLEDLVSETPEMETETSFAKRLITGAAAEGYFEKVFAQLNAFDGCSFVNTTRFGCGFDFKIDVPDRADFLAVEVKGLSSVSGSVVMTEKEHRVADRLRDRYFLFVARNFAEEPFHTLYRDPLNCGLAPVQRRRKVELISWNLSIAN